MHRQIPDVAQKEWLFSHTGDSRQANEKVVKS